MNHSQICIAGAGIVGLTLALELHAHGCSVTVIDAGAPMQQASTAAAGMLAADDPHNPSAIHALSHLSLSLYSAFLTRIESLTGIAIPFQTRRTLQALPGNPALGLPPELPTELLLTNSAATLDPSSGFAFLTEHSVDPRQLAVALIAAIAATSIRTMYNSPVLSTSSTRTGVSVEIPSATLGADDYIDCTGAWANSNDPAPAFQAIPVKGQMLALTMPPDAPLKTTLRTEDIYIVPRTSGPNAGRAIVGATVEDMGFDKTVEPYAIESLRRRAIALAPNLSAAPIAESWAGLRPSTRDGLPLLGAHPTRPHHWLATGHYRNGILLAPATARVMAQLLLDDRPEISIQEFSPLRLISAKKPSSI